MSAGDSDKRERKKAIARPVVLVSVPDWPSQDPGRVMVYSIRPSETKAKRMVKRLQQQLPEYTWSWEKLTAKQILRLRSRPFRNAEIGKDIYPLPFGGDGASALMAQQGASLNVKKIARS